MTMRISIQPHPQVQFQRVGSMLDTHAQTLKCVCVIATDKHVVELSVPIICIKSASQITTVP